MSEPSLEKKLREENGLKSLLNWIDDQQKLTKKIRKEGYTDEERAIAGDVDDAWDAIEFHIGYSEAMRLVKKRLSAILEAK